MNIQTLRSLGSKRVLYVGEIGIIPIKNDTVCLYKYGISGNVYKRIVYNHMKSFDYFDLKLVKETNLNRTVESMFTETLKREKMHLKLLMNGRVQRELFYLKDPVLQLDWIQNLVDDLVIKAERGAIH